MEHLKSVAQTLLENAQIETINQVTSIDGPVVLAGGVLLICGDCGPGSAIRGQGDVVIEGDIQGDTKDICHIEVTGQVIVYGAVVHANIHAHTVRIGAMAKHIQITAQNALVVNDDLINANVQLGDCEQDKRDIDLLFAKLSDAITQQGKLERQLKVEERRVDKLFKNTRIVLSANVGKIFQTKQNRLTVNLQPVYKTLEGRSEKEIDKALQEFFAKAILGLLTQANRDFLFGQNKHRQEIFKGVVRDVRDFFFLARNCDKATAKVGELDEMIDMRLAQLNSRRPTLHVVGRLMPELKLMFTQPRASRARQEVFIRGDLARMDILNGSDPYQAKVERIHVGDDQVEVMDNEILKNCELNVTEGRVEWASMAELESAVA